MRIEFFDILRGISLIGMIFFHANYLLLNVFKFHYEFFGDGFMNIFGLIIVLIFIILSGYVNAMAYEKKSRGVLLKKVLHRFIPLAILAFGITFVTYTFFPEQRISWGIIHFFALTALLQPFFSRTGGWILFFVPLSFIISYVIAQLSTHNWIFIPFGIHYPAYYSADYYPLFPWFSYILLGQAIHYLFRVSSIENWLTKQKFPKFSWIGFLGKHSLVVYALHVPVLYIIFSLIIFLL